MKVTVKTDCTPDEARRLLGLPDFKPTQDALLAEITRRAQSASAATMPNTMLATWLPFASRSFEQAQSAITDFWAASFGPRRTAGADDRKQADSP